MMLYWWMFRQVVIVMMRIRLSKEVELKQQVDVQFQFLI